MEEQHNPSHEPNDTSEADAPGGSVGAASRGHAETPGRSVGAASRGHADTPGRSVGAASRGHADTPGRSDSQLPEDSAHEIIEQPPQAAVAQQPPEDAAQPSQPAAEQAPQAGAEQQPRHAAARQPEPDIAQAGKGEKHPQTAAAEPPSQAAVQQPQAAGEQHPQAPADQPTQAAGEQKSQPAAEQQPRASAEQSSQAAEPPQAPPEKKGFGQILAEFEQGEGGERQTEAAEGTGPAATGAGPASRATPHVGQKVSGKVVSITEEQVLVDLGAKSEGMIEAAQLHNAEGQLTVKLGDSVDAVITAIDPESGVIVLRKKASGGRGGHQEVATELRQAFQYAMPVEGLVTGINKGGAEVQVYGMRSFCPLSQLDLRYVEHPQQFIGQRLKFKVSRIEEGGRNRRPDIVLSRRSLLEEEAQAKAAELRARLQIGAVLKGRVTSLTSYGAFIDLGGLEGLLHVSEIGYSRLADPREALSVGQEVEVQVIKIEKGKDEKRPERISLSRRALERDPWRDAVDRFPEGAVVPGRVMRLESFGAFVEVAPGLEGLVHVSELGAGRRLNHAREAAQIGQDVRVRVLNVDPVKRRISLSMVLAEEHHEPVEETAPREPAAAGQQPTSFGALGDFFKSSNQRRK
jgi:small subunit ribosomal protein S1